VSEPAPVRTWLGFLAMVLGMFIAVLDIQVVTSSLAELQGALSASADEISWVQTSYLIAEIIVIPLSGILTRWLSTRILFVVSCAGFALASVLCALAWDLHSMIAFRALQGLLGAAMIPTVFSVPYRLFPRHQQEKSLIVIGLTATLAPTLGPVIGGWITETLSWRWIFLVNLPVSAVVIAAVWSWIDIDRPDFSVRKGFDLPGLLLMALTLGSLQYALEEGPRWDWLEHGATRVALLAIVICGALFLRRVLIYSRPVVDVRAFADRNFATGCVLSFVFGIGVYVPVYVLPLFLSQVRGYNALQIGTTMAVLGAFQFLSAPLAAALSRVIDLRMMLALGLALFCAGLGMNGFMNAEAAFGELFWPQAVRGLALMLCFLPINTLALATLPPERLANASGLYNLTRNLGGAIGIAGVNTIFESRYDLHVARIGESMRGEVMPPELDIRLLADVAGREGAVMAYNDLFLTLALVFALVVALMPLIRPHGTIPATSRRL
jgi:DHA2 family multidrug resistance protein